MPTQRTSTGHDAQMRSRFGDIAWTGDLWLFYSADPKLKKLTRYTVKGVPAEVACMRQSQPRGPWEVVVFGEVVGTEARKTDAQYELAALLGIGWRNQ